MSSKLKKISNVFCKVAAGILVGASIGLISGIGFATWVNPNTSEDFALLSLGSTCVFAALGAVSTITREGYKSLQRSKLNVP